MASGEEKADMMKAAVLYKPSDLRVEQVRIPELEDGFSLIRVKVAGICGSDLPRILKTGTYHFPTIPGHEFSGEIAALPIGKNDWKLGDRVVAAPLMPCCMCENCRKGYYGQCDHYDFLGSRRDGAFAEYVAVPIRNLLRLPDAVSFLQGAMIEPAAVTLHGFFKVGITPEDTVTVLGVGAIGIFAVALAKIMGAKQIIAVDIAQDKLDMAKRYGAHICVNSLSADPVETIEKLTEGEGTSVVVEAAGCAVTQEQALRIAKSHARVLFLGTAHHPVEFPPASFEHILRRELVLYGSWNSYSSPFPGNEWHEMIGYLSKKKLDLNPMITKVVALDELPETIAAMNARTFAYNKVLLSL